MAIRYADRICRGREGSGVALQKGDHHSKGPAVVGIRLDVDWTAVEPRIENEHARTSSSCSYDADAHAHVYIQHGDAAVYKMIETGAMLQWTDFTDFGQIRASTLTELFRGRSHSINIVCCLLRAMGYELHGSQTDRGTQPMNTKRRKDFVPMTS